MNNNIPGNVGQVRHADYTGNLETETRLTEVSLTFLIKNVHELASKLDEYQRIVLFHSPKERALLTTNAFRQIFKRRNVTVLVEEMSIIDLDKRLLTKDTIEYEIGLAEIDGVKSFFLFITHEPVIVFYFQKQGQEIIPPKNCEIITRDFTIAGHPTH